MNKDNSIIAKIISWVKNKPMVMFCFGKNPDDNISAIEEHLDRFTFMVRHGAAKGIKIPTLCVLQTQKGGMHNFYLGALWYQAAASTLDSRLTIKALHEIAPNFIGRQSEANIVGKFLQDRVIKGEAVSVLSSQETEWLINLMAQNHKNRIAIEKVFALLLKTNNMSDNHLAQEDAVRLVFDSRDVPRKLHPEMENDVARLHEDNIIQADAARIPGFDAVAPDVQGRYFYRSEGEEIVVYVANKKSLEEMLGVDLIYINQSKKILLWFSIKCWNEKQNLSDGHLDLTNNLRMKLIE